MNAKDIATLCLHQEKHFLAQLQSTEHRIAILSKWDIPRGAKVLELGCGQGDCTAVLAEIVGPDGHVTAVDPGPLDYGRPFTLGQAQAHLSSGRLGSRITWKQANPIELLKSDETEYDVAVLVICLWYFTPPSVINATLNALAKQVRRVCIAEWSLSSSTPEAHTHVLAAFAQAALASHDPTSTSNVRTIVSPTTIKAAAEEVGWKLEKAASITPADNVLDGRWEAMRVKEPEFLEEIHQYISDEREKSLAVALRDATLQNVEKIGGLKKVASMDVWCGEFVRG